MKLIYGSQAIQHWFSDFERTPNGLDIITDRQDLTYSKGKTEYYYIPEFFDNFKNKNSDFLDKDYLYTFKVSHLAWNINWEKHMKDAQFLKSHYCKLDMDLYNILYKKQEGIHGKKKVKMGVHNSDFFKSNIYRKHNHEELHEHFMFFKRPLNEKIRCDLDSPLCSEKLWDKLDHPTKLRCALEEIFVLAAERYILVENPIPAKIARVKILKWMITSSTSGWFCLFLIEHFDSLRIYSQNYFEEKLKDIK